MDKVYEIIKILIPIIITGTVTYWVAKLNKSPIDKIAISYDRIYYPLMRIIKNYKEKDYKLILEETKKRLQKYDKYASRTTITACKLLEENINNKNARNYYYLLTDDISKYNRNFRRRLGYPEPLLFNIFKYLSTYKKWLLVLTFGILFFIFSIYVFGILGNMFPIIAIISLYFAVFSGIITIISLIVIAIYKIKYAFPNIIKRNKTI